MFRELPLTQEKTFSPFSPSYCWVHSLRTVHAPSLTCVCTKICISLTEAALYNDQMYFIQGCVNKTVAYFLYAQHCIPLLTCVLLRCVHNSANLSWTPTGVKILPLFACGPVLPAFRSLFLRFSLFSSFCFVRGVPLAAWQIDPKLPSSICIG